MDSNIKNKGGEFADSGGQSGDNIKGQNRSKSKDKRFGRKFKDRRSGRREMGVDLTRVRREKTFFNKEEVWNPKTSLGKKVQSGEIKTIDEVLKEGKPIREVEIVDKLLPNLESEVIYDLRVQRVTMNGRVTRFKVVVVVGNKDGYIGIGQGKAKEKQVAVNFAIADAKKNIKKIERGCGSWFCNCGRPHSILYTTTGKSGSVRVKLIPASAGLGIVGAPVVKKVLTLAGINDVWTYTEGETRTSINLAAATIDALIKASEFKK